MSRIYLRYWMIGSVDSIPRIIASGSWLALGEEAVYTTTAISVSNHPMTPAVLPGGSMRPARTLAISTLLAALILALTLPTNAAFASGSGRLGKDVLPTFERLKLNLDARKEAYSGSAHIDLRAVTSVDSFQLHSEG